MFQSRLSKPKTSLQQNREVAGVPLDGPSRDIAGASREIHAAVTVLQCGSFKPSMQFVIQITLKCAKYFNSAQAANKCMSTVHCKLLDHSREIIRLAGSSRPHQTANSGPVDICPAYIQQKSTYTQSVLFYINIYLV